MRGMGALQDTDVVALIDRLASAGKLGVFVGAGVSVEAGLPSWLTLIRRLLDSIADETPPFRRAAADGSEHGPGLIEEFSTRSLAALGPLGAGAVVKVHFGDSYRTRLSEALYRDVDSLAPGPTAVSIARYIVGTEPERRAPVLTTNFDPLLEIALRQELARAGDGEIDVSSVLPGDDLRPDSINVVHLHGLLAPKAGLDDAYGSEEIVFAEDEFLHPRRMARAAKDLATSEFGDRPYLFLGASLTDTNILGDLYEEKAGKRDQRHAAIAVSQLAAMDLDPDAAEVVVEALQDTAAARLRGADVDVAFVDTYSEASQFVSELDLQRASVRAGMDGSYGRSGHCWAQRARRFEQRSLSIGLLPCEEMPDEFIGLQKELRRVLSDSVECLSEAFAEQAALRSIREHLALHLWVHAPAERLLTMVAQSDLRMYSAASPQVARATLPTGYLVVEAICNGTVVEARGEGLRSSRWGSMIAVPFRVWEESEMVGATATSLSAGVLVLASSKFGEDGLARLQARPSERTPMVAALARLGSDIVGALVAAAPESERRRPALHHFEPRGSAPGRFGHRESGPRRIGPETVVGGAPPDDVDLGRWSLILPEPQRLNPRA
jgi:SIR2-like domain